MFPGLVTDSRAATAPGGRPCQVLSSGRLHVVSEGRQEWALGPAASLIRDISSILGHQVAEVNRGPSTSQGLTLCRARDGGVTGVASGLRAAGMAAQGGWKPEEEGGAAGVGHVRFRPWAEQGTGWGALDRGERVQRRRREGPRPWTPCPSHPRGDIIPQ